MGLEVGHRAGDFSLFDQNGKSFKLSEHLGNTNIALYFYPKNETPGCIAEACSFRDHNLDLEGYNCKVIGISSDSIKSHARFAKHYNLPFTLLSDSKNLVRKLYGVESSIFGFLPGRKTYLINKQGFITHIFDYQFKAKKHVLDTLKALANE